MPRARFFGYSRSETEDATIGGDKPVAPTVCGRGHANDGLVERRTTSRAVEHGITVREDATIGGDQVVAARVGGGGHANDGLVERGTTSRAVELGITVGEDASV